MSLEDDLLAEAKARKERLEHPPGGHTSSELDIVAVPTARALIVARIEAEAEDRQRDVDLAEQVATQRAALIMVAEAENRRRDASERAIAHKIARIVKADLTQQTEPRLTPPPPKLRDIARAVADYYGVTVLDLAGDGRSARVTRPRQVFCYIARKMTFRSFPDLGRALGGRDHTTALWSFNKIASLLPTDAQLAADIAAIRRMLEGDR